MADSPEDTGVIQALIERFNEQRLPRALKLKDKVDKGERLSEQDIEFLQEIFRDANDNKALADRHPEWQALVARVLHLYKEITEKALQNEKAS